MTKFNDNFIDAVKNNDLPLVRKMIENGAYVNYKSDLALRISVNNGYLELTKLLLHFNARINIKNSFLIMIAVQNSFYEITQLLLDNHINYINKSHLMLNVAKNNNDTKMLILLNNHFEKHLYHCIIRNQHPTINNQFLYYKNERQFKEKLNRSSNISKEKIKELLDGYDISELIKQYISISPTSKTNKSKKGNLYAICPFHKESTPSFSIPSNRSFFHCFGCGESGNAIQFLMKYEKTSFTKAVRKLSQVRGIKLK